MVDPPLDELYFDWLYAQVGSDDVNPSKTYMRMLEQLFFTEFVWTVPNDDNRAEDGRDLRREFLNERKITGVDPEWVSIGCSMLEMLIGLSRRLSYEADGEARDWFWHVLRNVGLDRHHDGRRYNPDSVGSILERVIWRTYLPDGHGGLFPLKEAHEDQRDVELWYQLSAYLLERMD